MALAFPPQVRLDYDARSGGHDISELELRTVVGEIDLKQFAVCIPASGWTTRVSNQGNAD